MLKNHPFQSFSEDEFRIIDVKKCEKEFLFHGTSKKLDFLDPAHNNKYDAYGGMHEYGVPVLFASDVPSNAFCYEPTDLYLETKKKYGTSVYHRLIHEKHKILLGARLKGSIHVLTGETFYKVTREDFEVGEWVCSTEWVSVDEVKPVEIIEITEPYDWEMIPEYEFLGLEYVGEMEASQYLSIATNESVKDAIEKCIKEPFVPVVPDALKKYF